MLVRFFDPGLGYRKIKKEIDSEMQRVLSAGDLILRDDVERFENNLAKFVGTKYAVALNSGTDALYLALRALGVVRGMKVAVPSHTFVATAQVVVQVGADPILYDMDFLSGPAPKEKINVLMLAHIAGEVVPCPSLPIPVIEDACQALGAVKNPTSKVQCWSFYPAKLLGAYGDAGAITTNDKNIYEEVKELRNHYKRDYSKWGINSRMDNLQAAILNVKLKYLPDVLNRRQEIAEMYYEGLKDLEISGKINLPSKQKNRVYQDFILQVYD